jgi:hypothetical protein
VDETVRDQGAGHVGDQQPAPLHRHVLEDHQVNRQGTQPRADRESGAWHAGRARRDMRRAAGAADLVQVVLDSLRGRDGDLLLLEGPGNSQFSSARQVTPARAGTAGEVILGAVRDLPGHGRARAARLLALLRGGGPLRGPPLPPRRLPPGPSSELGGSEEFPLFRDIDRSALSSCSRRSATIASKAAICSPWTATWASCLSCSAIRSACWRSARHADPPATAHRSQQLIIQQPPGHYHVNTTAAAET